MKLRRFLAARILHAVGALFLAPLLTLFLLGRAPGDYLNELAANPQVSPETLSQLRLQYGLDSPFYTKFGHWIRSTASGDLGYSFVYQRPIGELLASRVWNTVLLNATALLIAWIAGMALGFLAAMKRGSALDGLIGILTTWLVSTPAILLSLVLLAAAVKFGLPVGGMVASGAEDLSLVARLADMARHLLLPALAVASVWLPVVARHTRTTLLETQGAPYLSAARAKGLGPTRLFFHYMLRNALNPLATLFGLSISALLSASLLVEVVMSWPGIGQLTFDAVLRRDIFLVVDLAVLSALLLLVGNLIGDLLLYWADPRIREA